MQGLAQWRPRLPEHAGLPVENSQYWTRLGRFWPKKQVFEIVATGVRSSQQENAGKRVLQVRNEGLRQSKRSW